MPAASPMLFLTDKHCTVADTCKRCKLLNMIRLVIFISCSHYIALLSLLLLEVVSFFLVIFLAAAQKPCIVLHSELQECFHLRKLPTSAARSNCWNNSTTSKSQQLKIRGDITASGLNFHSSCLLCHLPSLHA